MLEVEQPSSNAAPGTAQSGSAGRSSFGRIPANFLVDADGVIVAKNLRGERLDDKLAELIDGIAPPAEDAKEPLEQPAES